MAEIYKRQNSNPVKILLVEDDDGDAKMVQRAFLKAEIQNEIIRAYDGVEALDILKGENGQEKISRPFLMLVDLNMPRMGGLELIEKIRADMYIRDSVIFALTTSRRAQDKEAAYNLNVAGYITKETAGKDFRELLSMIDSYWEIVELPT